MIADKAYEKKLLQEIKGLNEEDIEKILRMIHFMKNEILFSQSERTNNIMNYAGMLSDLTDEEIEVFMQFCKRRELFGGREVGL